MAATLAAQEPRILSNRGDPIRIDYNCAEEDLQWARMSCDEQACPIYLELSAIAANGQRVLAAGNLHGNSATIFSILLASNDAGATWSEPAKRMRGDAIDQLQFYDSLHAWAAGETQYPLARDPFILLTADGGASWTEHAVGDEGSPGSVQRLHFDSAANGELIIDGGKAAGEGRYITYESVDGGDNWKVRGASGKVPPGKPESDRDWRIRPSRDGMSWEIEKRNEDAWSRVAAFLIETASCRIVPGQTNEPKP